MPRIFFWFGQMKTQTLNSMIVPSQAPIPMITVMGPELPEARPNVKVSMSRPGSEDNSQRPVTNVATAPQRNHNKARGATYFEMPAPPGPPLSAAAAARAGVCTTLK